MKSDIKLKLGLRCVPASYTQICGASLFLRPLDEKWKAVITAAAH